MGVPMLWGLASRIGPIVLLGWMLPTAFVTYGSIDAKVASADGPTSKEKSAKLLPIPTADELKKADSFIDEVYKDKLRTAKSNLQKQTLAKDLVKSGMDTKDDPIGRFALLRLGQDLAAEAGDYATASTAIEALGTTNSIDILKMKLNALEKVSLTVRLPKRHESFIGELVPVVHFALDADRYDVATKLSELVLRSSNVLRNSQLAVAGPNLVKDVEEQSSAWRGVSTAIEKVEARTSTPSEKLAVAKFFCFFKGRWADGLPMLVDVGDDMLRTLAADELTEPTEAVDQLKVADSWWSYGEGATGLPALRIRHHAAIWYKKAIPKLTGLSASRAKLRIESAATEYTEHFLNPLTEIPESSTSESRTSEPPTSNEPIDLLKVLRLGDFRKQVVGGDWQDSTSGISSGKSAYSRLTLPQTIESSYELLVEFEVTGGEESVAFVLPIKDQQVVLIVDGWPARGHRTFLCNVQGLEAISNPNSVKGKHLRVGKTHACHIETSWKADDDQAKVVFELDGKKVFSWSGKISELSPQNGWQLPKKQVAAIGCYATPTTFKKVELILK